MKIRKSLLVVFALFAATVVCLYGAVSADLPFAARIAFGAAAAVCYVLFPPYPLFQDAGKQQATRVGGIR